MNSKKLTNIITYFDQRSSSGKEQTLGRWDAFLLLKGFAST